MNKYILALVAVLVLAFTALTIRLRFVNSELEKQRAETAQAQEVLQTLAEARKVDTKVLTTRAKAKSKASRRMASLSLKLDQALGAHPDWTNTPVPQEVQDALRSDEPASAVGL